MRIFNLKCIFIILFNLLFFLPQAQALPSGRLIAEAKQYDQRVVDYQGELVGSVLRRGNFAWLNLSDGENAIGVWVSSDMAQGVKYGGSYHMRGDLVKVTGIFNRACLEHGGGLDIHAQSIQVLKQGSTIPEVITRGKIFAMICLLGVLTCLLIIRISEKKRSIR